MADRADIETGVFVVNELREIFVLMKKFLRNLEVQMEVYPVYTIVGTLIRNFALKFVSAWRRPLEKVLLTIEDTDYGTINRRFSSTLKLDDETAPNPSKEDIDVKNRIALITTLVDRVDDVLEFVQLASSTSATSESDDDSVKEALGSFGLWLCTQMKPFPKIVYPKVLEQFSESSRGLNDLRPKGC